MKCHYCGGKMKKGKTTYTINRKGYHLLIDDIPAWICTQCNEPYFEGNAIDAIQAVIRSLDSKMPKLQEVAIG